MMANIASLHVHIYGIIICACICTISCKSPENYCKFVTPTRVECETSIPIFDQRNVIQTLTYTKCASGLLSNKTLNNMNSLKTLYINCNFSDEVHLELEMGVFDSVKRTLVYLELNNNNIRILPDRIFCELNNVYSIDISFNALTDIKYIGFGTNCGEHSQIPNLQILNIESNTIKIFHNGTFRRLINLTRLTALDNGLEHIEMSAFEGITQITTLDLRRNRLTMLHPQIFRNLDGPNYLHLEGNALTSNSLFNVAYPKRLRALYLSHNQITTIEGTMLANVSQLRLLDLSYNHIRVIESGFASMSSLIYLYLNNAGIEEIKSLAFRGLYQLQTLDLSDNKLRNLEPGTFADVSKLSDSQTSGQHVHALQNAESWRLQTLKLARNEIRDLNAFASFNLRDLTELDVSENLIEIIKNDTFGNVSLRNHLHVNLSHNKIRHIELRAFAIIALNTLAELRLTLDNNELTNIDYLFHSTTITSLSMNFNKLKMFSYSSISLNLRTLSLNHNEISNIINTVSYDEFENMELQSMDLSYNRIKEVSSKDFPPWIENLALHNNLIEHVYEYLFLSLTKMKNLTLHNNKLEILCNQTYINYYKANELTTTLSGNPFNCSCEMEWLKYEYSTINSQFGYIKDLESVKCRSRIPRYGAQFQSIKSATKDPMFLCKSTHEQSNSCQCRSADRCEFPCPKKCSCHRDMAFDFGIVDCSKSNLISMPVITFRPVSTLYVFVDGNTIKSINEFFSQTYPNITKLYLNNSQVETISVNAFKTLTSLELLQLDNNMLTTLPDTIFTSLNNLKELYLAQNKLEYLNDQIFSPLKSLKILHLNNNSLVKFSVWELSKLSNLMDIGLKHNQWSCDCTYVDKFRTWLQEFVDVVQDAKDLVCSDQQKGQEMPLISYTFEECYQGTPSQFLAKWAPAWGSALGVFLLLFLAIIFAFIYRREMQVLIYSRYGVRIFSNNVDETDENKLYDAFIAYSSMDEDFLVNDFLPPLEQTAKPYKLCLHHRDFLAGGFITDSILEAIEKSRRTIILLSENFIKSEWCRFEFKTAHIQMMKDRCNRVIIVVLKEIPKNLDSDMNLYLTTNTYLKWGDKLFWEKLCFALPDKNNT